MQSLVYVGPYCYLFPWVGWVLCFHEHSLEVDVDTIALHNFLVVCSWDHVSHEHNSSFMGRTHALYWNFTTNNIWLLDFFWLQCFSSRRDYHVDAQHCHDACRHLCKFFITWLCYSWSEGNGLELNVNFIGGRGLHFWVNVHETTEGEGELGKGEGEDFDDYDWL